MNAPTHFKISATVDICLTDIRATDASAFVEHLNDEEIYANTLRIPFPYTIEHAEQFIDIAAKAASEHGHPTCFAIRDEDERLIGGCGFDGLSYGHRAELGYWLARPYWGQGIMTAVVRAACDHAVTQWKLARITAHVFDQNHRSARVLEKNNFQFEGLLRKHHHKDGKFIDSRLYALIS